MNVDTSLELARSMFGPLSDDARERLLAVIEMPCQETWQEAYSVILDGGMMTLWSAVLVVDPTFPDKGPTTQLVWRCVGCGAAKTAVDELDDPERGDPCATQECLLADRRLRPQSERVSMWERIPDRATLINALRYATH